jgi:hypothetical protein
MNEDARFPHIERLWTLKPEPQLTKSRDMVKVDSQNSSGRLPFKDSELSFQFCLQEIKCQRRTVQIHYCVAEEMEFVRVSSKQQVQKFYDTWCNIVTSNKKRYIGNSKRTKLLKTLFKYGHSRNRCGRAPKPFGSDTQSEDRPLSLLRDWIFLFVLSDNRLIFTHTLDMVPSDHHLCYICERFRLHNSPVNTASHMLLFLHQNISFKTDMD